jgi:DNA replication and repair protein RecF
VATGKRYAVTRLTLTNFRNYESVRFSAPANLCVLVGANGAGKTNILEALSLLIPGRGLRNEDFGGLARKGAEPYWGVSAEIEQPSGTVQLGTAWRADTTDAEGSASARNAMIDSVPHKSAGVLAQYVKILWLTPAMDRLFAGSPGERRRFFDRLVALFDNSHVSRVTRFEKLLRERNRVLQDAASDTVWLNSIETQMSECAVAIAASRSHAIKRVAPNFAADGEGSFPWGRVTPLGELELETEHLPAVQVEENYRRILRDARGLDRQAGRCLRGPHRSDFEVIHGPKDMLAEACSTGEQKALLLGLILAQAAAAASMLGAAPVLLLDEAVAHLDQLRRMGLFERLQTLGGQAWLTGTDRLLFDGIGPEAVVYRVENGHVSESI